jgi:hypothetical protein
MPDLVRSVVGESHQFPAENRRALGQGLTHANRYVAEYLAAVMAQGQLTTSLSPEQLAGVLNSMILGYAVIELTSEFHELWKSRTDFLDTLVQLFMNASVSSVELMPSSALVAPAQKAADIADLPATLVHEMLQRAKKVSEQDYALAYVLFGAGLTVARHQRCPSARFAG